MKLADIKLRNSTIYSVFIRNFSDKGDFNSVTERIPYIKDLGFDIIYLMPIHPTGILKRKGNLGSPYSIKDFYSVNPELGTEEEFKKLIDTAHINNLKVIIDVVYHHTSWDSKLIEEHEDWFYHKEDGKIGNKVGDWYDIADLDFKNRELWNYLLGALKKWVKLGVDGFRCDVAPLIPMDFWAFVREELNKLNSELIFLSESVEPGFITYLRSKGFTAHSDSETFTQFDMLYDYDIKNEFVSFMKNEISMKEYLDAIRRQEYIYPVNYVKLRFLENHDNPRAREIIPDERRRYNMMAFLYFIKGSFLFYNGQETFMEHSINLFDMDKIEWEYDENVIELVKILNRLKKDPIMADGNFEINEISDNTAEVKIEKNGRILLGYFNIGPEEENIHFDNNINKIKVLDIKKNFVTPKVIEIRE